MTIELPPKARAKLEKLSEQTDQSLSEVIRRALSLYNLVGAEAAAGNRLIIRGREGEKELVLTEFEDAKLESVERESRAPLGSNGKH
jgi:predicted transcriptional regulator